MPSQITASPDIALVSDSPRRLISSAFMQQFSPIHPPTAEPAYAVVVSSCDAYRDLWPFFFHFYFRHAPTLPRPVYLISNFTRFADERVRTILTGPDRHWGNSLAYGLKQAPAEWILYLQDDYLLSATLDEAQVREDLARLQFLNGHFLSLVHQRNDCLVARDETFRIIPRHNFFADLQAALWRRDTLLRVVCPHSNPWRGESAIRALAQVGEVPGYYCQHEGLPPLITYVEAVRGKFWRPEGLAYLKKHGLTPNFTVRPYPRAGQEWWAKGVRSLHKRRMKLLDGLRGCWAKWITPAPIRPLTQHRE